METRPLGRGGARVGVIGICPGDGPQREAVVRRARELGCTLIWSGRPPEGAGLVRYNVLDQKKANEESHNSSHHSAGPRRNQRSRHEEHERKLFPKNWTQPIANSKGQQHCPCGDCISSAGMPDLFLRCAVAQRLVFH